MFPIGVTTVTCTATNKAGTTSTATFTVTVVGGPGQLQVLAGQVAGVGPGNSLAAKVAQAQSYLSSGNTSAVCSTLGSFVSEAQAQSGKQLTTSQAAGLIAAANRIQSVLTC